MKTYWLTGRDGRTSAFGKISKNNESTGTGGGGNSPATSSHSRGYSPVTFAGVAGNTPKGSPAHSVGIKFI